MKRLIEAEDLSKVIKEYFKDCIEHNKHNIDVIECNADIQNFIDNQPTVTDIEKVIGQYKWERDVAISQLEELGIGFGEKVDDKVVVAKNEITTKSKGSDE